MMLFKAKHPGTCGCCKESINLGDEIVKLDTPARIRVYSGQRNQYVHYKTTNYGHAECTKETVK